jgi:hypothetical protein
MAPRSSSAAATTKWCGCGGWPTAPPSGSRYPGTPAMWSRWRRAAGAHEQITALADRAAAHVSVDDPDAVARLLDSLRAAGAHEQATALAERLSAGGRFDQFQRVNGTQSQFGREPNGDPAVPWDWADLD